MLDTHRGLKMGILLMRGVMLKSHVTFQLKAEGVTHNKVERL